MIKHIIGVLLLLAINCLSLLADNNHPYKEVSTSHPSIELQYHIDAQELMRQDAENEAKGYPVRIAVLKPMQLNMDTVGTWRHYDDGSRIWTFTIDVPNSHGFITYFEQFVIPQGAELYVYSESGDSRTSMYTSEENIYGGRYSTEIDFGHRMTFEYVAPKSVTTNPLLIVDQIGYKYKTVGEAFYTSDSYLRATRADEDCTPNVNCPEGDDWQLQKRGVVKLRTPISGGVYLCSGSVVNNAENNNKPYVLTADHCFYTKEGVALNMEVTEFIFEYEYLGCSNGALPTPTKMLVGSNIRARTPLRNGSDGGLLEIKNPIPDKWKVQYNGWSLQDANNVHLTGAIIHHPAGVPKKISTYNSTLTSYTWNGQNEVGAPYAHWRAYYNVGVTAGGSSGSPIFNQEKLIVGTLSGGSSLCGTNGFDLYGKMSHHWDKYASADLQMKRYLDPRNTGITKLRGISWDGVPDDGSVIIPPVVDTPDMYVTKSEGHIVVNTKEIMKEVKVTNLQGYVLYRRGTGEVAEHQIPIFNMNRGAHILQVKTVDGKTHKTKFIR